MDATATFQPSVSAAQVLRGLVGLAGVFFLGVVAYPGTAQVVSIDEASYRLTRSGSVIGEESITIHRLGLGEDARIIGQSEIRFQDGSQARPRLEATTDLQPTIYRNEFTGAEEAEVVVSRVGRRFVSRSRSAAGEAQREFPASATTAILEPEVVLLYYFLQPWVVSDGAEITTLDPRSSMRRRVTVTELGSEEVRIGRNPIQARHLRLESSDSRCELWVAEDGRVLRVNVPSTGFQAERLPE